MTREVAQASLAAVVAALLLMGFFFGIIHVPRTPPLTDYGAQKVKSFFSNFNNVDPLQHRDDRNQARGHRDPDKE